MREQRRTFLCGLTVALAVLAACGGRETTASKSAAAYREAQAKGTPVGSGDNHGHDQGRTSTDTVDHSTHISTSNDTADAHAGMDHGSAADHAAMGHGTTTSHAGHGSTAKPDAHASHRSAAPVGDAHAQHRAQPNTVAATPHAGHGPILPGAKPTQPKAPSTTGETTLRPDDFDAPAAISVAEAAKASGAQPDNATVYTCPMHPEVIRATPGTCPKCGMTLVKKDSK